MKRAFDQRAPCTRPCPWSATAFMPPPVAGAAGHGMRPPLRQTDGRLRHRGAAPPLPPPPAPPPPPRPPPGGGRRGMVSAPRLKKKGGGRARGAHPHRCACRDLTV